ncbi:MAG: GtrA family protein [Spirochaetales bacterium]|nr:GtrA family protein [Spirochaetales bacterium]
MGRLSLKEIYTSVVFKQFITYIPLAGLATLVDWGSFYLFTRILRFDPYISVIVSYTLGGLTNYTLNKIFNFRDKVKTIGYQMAVYAVIMAISYGLTLLFMFLLIKVLFINELVARMMTTAVVLIYNFIMHRSFTFNEKIQAVIAEKLNNRK